VLGLVLSAGACGEVGGCADRDRLFGTSDQLGGPPDPEDALVDYLPGRMGGTDYQEQSRAAGEVTYEVYDGETLRGTVTLGDAGGGWHVDWARFCS
jgi:hypothetical protein